MLYMSVSSLAQNVIIKVYNISHSGTGRGYDCRYLGYCRNLQHHPQFVVAKDHSIVKVIQRLVTVRGSQNYCVLSPQHLINHKDGVLHVRVR